MVNSVASSKVLITTDFICAMLSLLYVFAKNYARKALKTDVSTPREKNKPITVENVLSEFYLSNGTLRRMMTQMNERMNQGLIGGLEMSSIAMLPSFVPFLPDGNENGRFLAMDLGGSNLRVMLLEARSGQPLKMTQTNVGMTRKIMNVDGKELFDFIVNSLFQFLQNEGLADENLALGFTFSYPCDQQSLRCARLLRWTKGFNNKGVEGKDVVQLLEQAIDRHGGIKVRVVALVNDTVGTQVATALDHGSCELGVIIGTGTNAAYMEKMSNIPKLAELSAEDYPFDEMIIDTEWGGFADNGEAEYIRTRYDRQVDSKSVHPGVQCFDKLVAGMYMGEIVRLVVEELTKNNQMFCGIGSDPLFTAGSFPTKFISEILNDDPDGHPNTKQILDELGIYDLTFADILILREICLVVARRCAYLAAAAISCVVTRLQKETVTVGIDGSTYHYLPGFSKWVNEKMIQLLPKQQKFNLVVAGDGSGKGAAMVASIAHRLIEQQTNAMTNGYINKQ